MSARNTVVRVLATRRAYQSSSRVLDSVDSVLAATRRRTGITRDSFANTSRRPGLADSEELDSAMDLVSTTAAYQMSRRTAASIRQRSLTDFLR